MDREPRDEVRATLHEHLARWGLKRFTSDADYFAWQREQLSSADLIQLRRVIERKQEGECSDEVAFYDLIAQPQILPVLYSQRYEYYIEIGSRVATIRSCCPDMGCNSISAHSNRRLPRPSPFIFSRATVIDAWERSTPTNCFSGNCVA